MQGYTPLNQRKRKNKDMPPIEWKGLQILETEPSGDVYMVHPTFSTGETQRIKINRVLMKSRTEFQEVVIADTEEFGRCLVIDGIIQSCEREHEIYDREMLKLLGKKDRRLLILGGGDGDVAKMALKMNPKLDIEMIEIDGEVSSVVNSGHHEWPHQAACCCR